MTKILILGRLPPPVGGVTNHVNRLIENLPQFNFEAFTFCDLGKENVPSILRQVFRHNVIHLHISRPWLQLLSAAFCKISGKKLLITYHGNWGRYHWSGNLAVNISAWMAYVPIVQNEDSFKKARNWNARVVNISTHLPPPPLSSLDNSLAEILEDFRKNQRIIICTNAWNLTFDKMGKEIYGVSDIVRSIRHECEIGLIVSDPSGNHQKLINKMLDGIPRNVRFITFPHDFRHVLTLSDAFIRNTTTDGVSLSIYEAIELDVPILASSAVPRPAFCEVFEDVQKIDFEKAIAQARKLLAKADPEKAGKTAMEKLVGLYVSAIGDQTTNVARWKKTKA